MNKKNNKIKANWVENKVDLEITKVKKDVLDCKLNLSDS